MVCNASNVWSSILDNDAAGNAALAHAVSLPGNISPSQITANQNDYNPANLTTASVLRLTSDASRNITSLAGGANGRILTVMNVGTNPIVLKNDDGATGTAANRFALTGDLTLAAKQSAMLMYDSTASRWRQIANGTATGSGDNLGNHTATQNVVLGSNWLSGDGGNEGVQIDSAGKVGVGTATMTGAFNVRNTSTASAADSYAMYLDSTQSVANTGTFYGIDSTPTYSAASGTLAALYGVVGVPQNASPGTVNTIIGTGGTPQNTSSGTVAAMFGAMGATYKMGTGPVTTMFGLYGNCTNANATGTVGTCYQLYLDNIVATGAVTNKWGVYQADATAKNFFGGNTQLDNAVSLSGDISPAQITANQNDYNPASLSTASVLRLNTDASRNITSLAGGADGRIITIMNVGSFNIVLKNDDGATGTAANRFALTGDLTLAAKQSAILMYDSASSRWRQIANGTATGSGDNLGNHIATQNIQLGSYWLSGDGGNEGVFVDSAGKVGVGTTAPQAPLHIGAGTDAPNDSPLLYLAGTGTTVLALRDSSSDVEGQFYVYNGHVGMGSRSNHDFYLVANDSEEVVLTAAGRFGIGTNAPNTTLDVNGFIEWKGQARVSSDFSKTNDTTLAAIPGLSVALEAGKTYSFQIFLYTTQSGACCVSHIKADLNGGTATATTIIGNAVSFGGSNVNYTALNTSICTEPITTATATCFIAGTITVNAAGTFSPRFAQLGSNATPAIVKAGSSMIIDQIN
ncbi:hypothetical protein [Sinorhizobium meliloti]|uniref:hypothetical protein n=1 Tax=Rhizobium meliloti TaxID=382 RepID=UPI001F34A2E1|nr:hypothetical protein [Sinorhizobium meliloti]